MVAENGWIPSEKQYFGQAGTAFDFVRSDPELARKRLTELRAAQEKLSRSVNMKVRGMVERG